MLDSSAIIDWHAHVYFDPASRPDAIALRKAIVAAFPDVTMGRVHDVPVGPHPVPMYQVLFPPALFATLVPWLTLNRGELTVFLHPNTGEALIDHRDRALWLGAQAPLKLDVLK
ncbi:MAG: 4,5-dioxygenase [Alphaproteobacteria bacterium]|nr:4,5-dioxygenase [Alphaproteobacteria bacterium]